MKTGQAMIRRLRLGGIALLGLSMAACATGPGVRPDFAEQEVLSIEEAPLGGEALAQRKQDLSRALVDMLAFHATMASLIDRRDSKGVATFDNFVAEYLERHLDALLVAEWQSSHPEVQEIDANLRFVKAEVLLQMRYPRRTKRVIADIERRFAGRESMLVEYPVGEQSSIAQALEIVKNKRW